MNAWKSNYHRLFVLVTFVIPFSLQAAELDDEVIPLESLSAAQHTFIKKMCAHDEDAYITLQEVSVLRAIARDFKCTIACFTFESEELFALDINDQLLYQDARGRSVSTKKSDAVVMVSLELEKAIEAAQAHCDYLVGEAGGVIDDSVKGSWAYRWLTLDNHLLY